MSDRQNKKRRIGFIGLLTIVLIALKASGLSNLGWGVTILGPLFGVLGVIFGIIALILILAVIVAILKN